MKKISALAIAGVFTASLAATAFAEMAEVKVGGEIRVRDAITNNYDFDDDAGDRTNLVVSRTRVNVDAKIDETTKAYISLQDTRVWGSETSTATTGNEASAVDVSQAYLQLDQLFGQPLSLKLGRQVLAYGEHRLIGSFEWSNNARRFDALKLMYNTDAFSVDLWSAKVEEDGGLGAAGTDVPSYSATTGLPVGTTANNEQDGYFNGIYATVKTIPANTLDLYILQKVGTTDVSATNASSARENFLTYGARLDGKAIGLDWTLEGAIQSGDSSDVGATSVDKKASLIAAKAGYTVPNTPSLRIGAEYVTSSGDDDSTDNDDETFDNLYPTNHPLYGVSDVLEAYTGGNALSGILGAGLTAYSVNVSAKPAKGLKLLAEYWDYSTTEDVGTEDHFGSEFNIQAWYALTPNVDLHAFWARFQADDDMTSTDDETDNVTLQVAVKF